ncbi:MAG: Ig-like domain-containing protein [bacterium]|nr:Ig-like domain-containing protein [bacterium]
MNHLPLTPKGIRRLMVLGATLFLLAPLMTGCKSSSSASGDTTSPTVSETFPVSAATGVAINSSVFATFGEAIDPKTLTTSSFTLSEGANLVSSAVSYSGTTAVLKPATNLKTNRTYTATLNTGIRDVSFNALAEKYTWSFTTKTTEDTTAPSVSLTIPITGSTSVAINTAVSASFDAPIDPTTITAANFNLKAGTTLVSGTLSYTGSSALIKPSSNLAANTSYTATITTGVQDSAGNALAADYAWSFITGATADTSIPTLLVMTPANGATAVATNTSVSATLSEPMDPTSVTSDSFTLKNGTTAVSGTVSYLGYTATFKPLSALAASTTYTAVVTTGFKDLAGNALAAANTWTFTTGATTDTTAPTVPLTSPANGTTAVANNRPVAVTFAEPMDPTSITTSTFTVKKGTTPVIGTVAYVGSTATFTPLSDLAFNTTYTATITTGATDLAGNGLASDYVWTFSTGTTTALGPAPVFLGTAGNFVLLAKAAISTTGTTAITGDLGISPAATTYMTGFSLTNHSSNTYATAAVVTGKLYASDMTPPTPSNMTTAIGDLEIAYTDAAGRSIPDFINTGAGTVSGLTLTPGLYKWGTGVYIPTAITISGASNDVWIFQIAETLTVANGVIVTLAGGALPENIFWQVGGQVTLGTTSQFKGIILAKTAVDMQTGATLNGRAFAQTAVTLDASTVTQP